MPATPLPRASKKTPKGGEKRVATPSPRLATPAPRVATPGPRLATPAPRQSWRPSGLWFGKPQADSDPETFRPTFSMVPPPPPRIKPWTPKRVLAAAAIFGSLVFVGVLAGRAVAPYVVPHIRPATAAPAATENGPLVTPVFDSAEGERADAHMDKKGRSPLAPGFLSVTQTFESSDGAYDIVIHFHGNTDLVEESYSIAGINAALVQINLGNGSGMYEDRFAGPGLLPDVLNRARDVMEKRGLKNAHQRRVALSAWSAGYGAVVRTLEQPKLADMIDTIILLDGIHAAYVGKTHEVDPARIEPYLAFARAAVKGDKMFFISHSDIQPPDYASTHETTDAVLEKLGVKRTEGGASPTMPALMSIEGVVPKKAMRKLEPTSSARAGNLIVRGFAGTEAEDHMCHLIQMANLALPFLGERWAKADGQP